VPRLGDGGAKRKRRFAAVTEDNVDESRLVQVPEDFREPASVFEYLHDVSLEPAFCTATSALFLLLKPPATLAAADVETMQVDSE